MYNNINFPEGTNVIQAQQFWLDAYDEEYKFKGPITFESSNIPQIQTIIVYKPFDFSEITVANRLYWGVESYTYLPTINFSNCTVLDMAAIKNCIIVFEGSLSKLTNFTVVSSPTNEKIYYPTGEPINVISNVIPSNKFIPYGDVPVKLRVLKDGDWMDGESILYDGVEMNYKGGGLYEITKTVLPRKRFNFPITIGEYFFKSPDVSDIESIIYLGDNSGNIHTIAGADILNLATDNSNGWFYDETNNGITNNDIGNNSSTTLTLSIPSLTIDIVYGQSSEKNYDYMTVLDADGKVLFTAKGVEGTDITATITNTSNTYVFKYSKDGSSEQGSDSCWINSITYTQLPDYPTN